LQIKSREPAFYAVNPHLNMITENSWP